MNRTFLSFEQQLWQFWHRYPGWHACMEKGCDMPACCSGNVTRDVEPLCYVHAGAVDPQTGKARWPANTWLPGVL